MIATDKPARRWNDAAPKRRGVYRVRSDGPSPNAGYRHWDGRSWGPLHAKFKRAREAGHDGRQRTLKYAVLWWGTPQ